MLSDNIISIAGFPVIRTTSDALIDHLLAQVELGKKTALLFANTNFVVRCRYLLNMMKRDDVAIVNDGVGLDIAVRFIYRNFFEENLCGSDFIPVFFNKSEKPLRVFMLGSRQEALDGAACYIQDVLHQNVVGKCDGYDGIAHIPDLVDTINRSKAQVLLVAMGNPVQEEWILHHLNELQANVVMGVGALFDFWSGAVPRAPRLIRRFRLEWLFRLCHEPRRMAERYTVDFFRFLLLCHRFR